MTQSKGHVRRRFYVETAAGALTGFFAVLTAVWHDWLETFGFDPDHHNGTAEWLIVGVLVVACCTLLVVSRLEWRRAVIV